MEITLDRIDRSEFFRLVGVSVSAILLQRCLSGCSTGTEPAPNTNQNVNLVLNTNETKYANLRNPGGYVVEQGIIVARTKNDEYVAVSAICTHQSSQIVFQSSNNRFYCPNHGSNFDLTGKVLNGPAERALTRYTVTNNANTGEIRVTG